MLLRLMPILLLAMNVTSFPVRRVGQGMTSNLIYQKLMKSEI